MTREVFNTEVYRQLRLAASRRESNENILDLRVFRHPYHLWENQAIYSTKEIDDAYEFIKDHDIWYIDIYENLANENEAVYTDCSIFALPAF